MTLQKILLVLSKQGYRCECFILNAKCLITLTDWYDSNIIINKYEIDLSKKIVKEIFYPYIK